MDWFGYYWKLIKRHETISLRCLDDLPPDAKQEREWSKQHGFRPGIFVPMLSGGSIIGALGFYGEVDTEREWPEELMVLLEFVSSIFVNALERKRSEELLQHQTERLRVLREMDQAILAARSPDEIAETALRHLRRLILCRRAAATVFDFEADEIIVLATNADDDISVEAGARFPIERFGRERIEKLRKGETVVVEDISQMSPIPPAIPDVRTHMVNGPLN